jgi:phospholipid/cholesterol/gamma-HCH transport system substrate-binding protein
MTLRKRNTAALGLMVLVAGALFVWGLFFLLGDPVWRRGMGIVVVMEDGAGLKRGDRVRLHGIEVGSIRGVELAPPRRVAVQVRLEPGIVLPADTRAAVRTDVFGTGSIELLPGEALVALEPGDTIRGGTAKPLPQVVEDLSGRIESVLVRADSLLSPKAVTDLHATAAVLPEGAAALSAALNEVHLAARALRRSAEGLEAAEAGPALGRALAELEGSARAFTAAAGAMERSLGSLASVLDKIDRGDGTLGRLVNDSTVYVELSRTLQEMRALATDVRERPKRYVSISIF